jgi:hypothetical protein
MNRRWGTGNRCGGAMKGALEQVRTGETLEVDEAFDEVEIELFGGKLANR